MVKFFSTKWSNLHVESCVAKLVSQLTTLKIFFLAAYFCSFLVASVVGKKSWGGWGLFGDVFEFFVDFVPVDYVPVCFDEFGSVVFVVDVVCVFEYVD